MKNIQFTQKDAIACFIALDCPDVLCGINFNKDFRIIVESLLAFKPKLKKDDFENYVKTCSSTDLDFLYDRLYQIPNKQNKFTKHAVGVFPIIEGENCKIGKTQNAKKKKEAIQNYTINLYNNLMRLYILSVMVHNTNATKDLKNKILADAQRHINNPPHSYLEDVASYDKDKLSEEVQDKIVLQNHTHKSRELIGSINENYLILMPALCTNLRNAIKIVTQPEPQRQLPILNTLQILKNEEVIQATEEPKKKKKKKKKDKLEESKEAVQDLPLVKSQEVEEEESKEAPKTKNKVNEESKQQQQPQNWGQQVQQQRQEQYQLHEK